MTVTKLETAPEPALGFERLPPQDLHAEQATLGGMLLSKDVIGEVVELVTATDFHRPAHQMIYRAAVELYAKGEPADAVTVADVLTKRRELDRAGGAPYLHTVLAAVPQAAQAAHYAQIVREKATLRRIEEAAIRIQQMTQAGGDASELANEAWRCTTFGPGR